MRVDGLLEAARVTWPDCQDDWRWLRRAVAGLRAEAVDAAGGRGARRTRPRHSAELFRLGLDLMAEAEAMAAGRPVRAAGRYRDGLLIALLAAHPLRARSLCALRLGRSLVHAGAGGWWLYLEAADIKTGSPYEAPLPAALAPFLERYPAVSATPPCTGRARWPPAGRPAAGRRLPRARITPG